MVNKMLEDSYDPLENVRTAFLQKNHFIRSNILSKFGIELVIFSVLPTNTTTTIVNHFVDR